MRLQLSALVVIGVLVGTMPGQQPEIPKPGPEHEKLKPMEGTWEATIQGPEGESKGVMNSKMGMGGLWMLDHFQGSFGGMKFEGRGATTYDPKKKKYVGVWIDSLATSPMLTEGNFDAKGRMVMTSEGPGPDGKIMKMTMVTEMKDRDNMTFTMTAPGPDGKEFQMMKISYKRKAK